jgi:hypothetical protein
VRSLTIAICAAALVYGACSKRDSSRSESERADSAVVASGHSNRTVVVREAGVRFDPPSTWPPARYRVDADSGTGESMSEAAYSVTLLYTPRDVDLRAEPLCRFLVFTREQWDRVQAEAGPPLGTTIESLDAWVYVVQLPQSNPYKMNTADAEQFDAMRLAIRDVRARFSVEGGGPDPTAAREAGDL